jgi:predicted dithiol-disulfide oxidoreductase (DUF899 family)
MDEVQHLRIYIARRPTDVYEFASDPRNLPRWAGRLARSEVRMDGDVWLMDSPLGRVRVKFAERNALGVMDHDVTLESGVTIHNPMRVVPHGDGSEFMFTLIRQPGTTDEQFAADKAAVESSFTHTYSAYTRGLDGLWGMYQWLDRAPRGRNETMVRGMGDLRGSGWYRRHDEYDKD